MILQQQQRLNILLIPLSSEGKFIWGLHYNVSNSFLYAYDVKIYQFKGKNLEIKPYWFCLKEYFKRFYVQQHKKTGLNWKVYIFCDSHETIISDIEDIQENLMKKHNNVHTSGFIKQMTIVLVVVLLCFDGPWTIKCLSISK